MVASSKILGATTSCMGVVTSISLSCVELGGDDSVDVVVDVVSVVVVEGARKGYLNKLHTTLIWPGFGLHSRYLAGGTNHCE